MVELSSAADIVARLELKPHPEGGHFRETFRDDRDSAAGLGAGPPNAPHTVVILRSRAFARRLEGWPDERIILRGSPKKGSHLRMTEFFSSRSYPWPQSSRRRRSGPLRSRW